MYKVINPVKVKEFNGIYRNVFCQIEYKDGKLSISGVVGPFSSGNCAGSCGQIDMSFKNDNYPDRKYQNGWTKAKFDTFLSLWGKWHLNDLTPGCEHQKDWGLMLLDERDERTQSNMATWTRNGPIKSAGSMRRFETHPNGLLGFPCLECGYEYGTAWRTVPVPQNVIDFLFSLPETKTTPAWV